MLEAIPLLALVHTLGAAIGTLYTTWSEVFYMKAASDGTIDRHERKYLRHLFRGLRIGVGVLVVTAVALVVVEYLTPNAPQAVVVAPFWGMQTLTVLLIGFGWHLSRRQDAWWLASAAMLTAWWMILLTDFGIFNSYTYPAFLLFYVLATFLVAAVLALIRLWIWRPKPL